MTITREQALKEYGSVVALANALGVTASRISHFKNDDLLPEPLSNKLQLLKPNIFMDEEVKQKITH